MLYLAALDCLIVLVQRDCDITLGDNNGNLAAHHAAKNNKLDCLRFLVKQGTSLEATQADRKTPAHVVCTRIRLLKVPCKTGHITRSNTS